MISGAATGGTDRDPPTPAGREVWRVFSEELPTSGSPSLGGAYTLDSQIQGNTWLLSH